MCILIFAFRGCYYLAHLYCKICFSLRVFAFEGLNTKLSLNVFLAWYIVTPGPLWLKLFPSLGRFLSRISYYLSSYVFLLRRRSFATRKVYISLEILLCLSQLSDRTYVSRAPAIYSSFWSVCHHMVQIDHHRVYFVYLIFIECVTMVSRDPLNQLRRTKEQPYARAN